MAESYYQILGVTRDADERDIKRAYYRMARELHPDKADNPNKARDMEQKFALVSTAYNLLKDADQRREYDRRIFGETNGSVATAVAGENPSLQQSENLPPRAAPPRMPMSMQIPQAGPTLSLKDMSAKRIAIAQKAFAKGLQLMKDKQYGKAAEFFEAAIQNNDGEACYHAKLAVALIEAKRSATRAIEAAQRAIEIDRYNLDYKFTLAHIYEAIGSKSNATKVYEDILRWDAGNQMAQQMLRELTRRDGLLGKLSDSISLIGSLSKRFKR